ncbi:MAG: peptidase M14, partial [Bacteroidetes bacterium]|nr:peptidase M14 [Bacteroidota bacterium]
MSRDRTKKQGDPNRTFEPLSGDGLPAIAPQAPRFHTHAERLSVLRAACEAHPMAALHEIGTSEEGRPIVGVVIGEGPRAVSLIAGNHADEPVGPETLLALVAASRGDGSLTPWLDRVRFVVVPHTNPDGAARNEPWMKAWPDHAAYLQHVDREPPGRDLEFGFPDMRVENSAVADFLRMHGPFALHMSLHGMAASEGAMLLINRPWTFRTQPLRDGFREAAR